MAMAGANLLALSDWPYGYYQFLRIVVTGYAIWLVAHQSTAGTKVWPWIFGVVAVLYNPVFKINMELDTRAVIKVIVALLVLAEVFASLERAQT